MASFNDLVIHPLNGHDIKADEVEQVNEHLQYLRHRRCSETTLYSFGDFTRKTHSKTPSYF